MKLLLLLVLPCLSCGPITYQHGLGFFVFDYSNGVNPLQITAVAECAAKEYDIPTEEAFALLEAVYLFPQENRLCTEWRDGVYSCYRGVFYCRSTNRRIELHLDKDCLADTALAHEFIHYLNEAIHGDCDQYHNDPYLWDKYGNHSMEWRIEVCAAEKLGC